MEFPQSRCILPDGVYGRAAMPSLKIHRLLPLFTVVALLFQALLPFYATYQPPTHADAAQMAALYGDKVLLCTGDGFKLVSWKELLAQKEKPAHHPKYECALCYVAAHVGVEPRGFVQAVLMPVVRQLGAVWTDSAHIAGYGWRKFLTRSPPRFSV